MTKGVLHVLEDDLQLLEHAGVVLAIEAEVYLRRHAEFHEWLTLHVDCDPPIHKNVPAPRATAGDVAPPEEPSDAEAG